MAAGLEIGIQPTVPVELLPPQIKYPDNMGQVPPTMIRDPMEMFIWQGSMKLIHSQRTNLPMLWLPHMPSYGIKAH